MRVSHHSDFEFNQYFSDDTLQTNQQITHTLLQNVFQKLFQKSELLDKSYVKAYNINVKNLTNSRKDKSKIKKKTNQWNKQTKKTWQIAKFLFSFFWKIEQKLVVRVIYNSYCFCGYIFICHRKTALFDGSVV